MEASVAVLNANLAAHKAALEKLQGGAKKDFPHFDIATPKQEEKVERALVMPDKNSPKPQDPLQPPNGQDAWGGKYGDAKPKEQPQTPGFAEAPPPPSRHNAPVLPPGEHHMPEARHAAITAAVVAQVLQRRQQRFRILCPVKQIAEHQNQ